ncbi:MAG TPA: hypothetical protein VE986_07445 [Hyphomicrobiales bacterium]|nr:hypothetical protein [Hyphomicrobiales bacterium]
MEKWKLISHSIVTEGGRRFVEGMMLPQGADQDGEPEEFAQFRIAISAEGSPRLQEALIAGLTTLLSSMTEERQAILARG